MGIQRLFFFGGGCRGFFWGTQRLFFVCEGMQRLFGEEMQRIFWEDAEDFLGGCTGFLREVRGRVIERDSFLSR